MKRVKQRRIANNCAFSTTTKSDWCGLPAISWARSEGLVRFALLTAQRRGKLGSNDAAMKWSDIKDGVWTIDVEEREKGTAHQIKLPQMVLDILKEQPRIAGNPYVFPGLGGNGPFNSFSRA